MTGNHRDPAGHTGLGSKATLQGAEGSRIYSGDVPSFEIAAISECLTDLNSLCFAPFPPRLSVDMNADVVCHTLEFCRQDAGQPLCHLYPLPKVSGVSSL